LRAKPVSQGLYLLCLGNALIFLRRQSELPRIWTNTASCWRPRDRKTAEENWVVDPVVYKIIATVKTLDIQSKDDRSPSASSMEKPTKKKLELLDPPNEILRRIFTDVYDGQEVQFNVGLGKMYGLGVKSELLIQWPRAWSPKWAPNLRLVSSAVKALVSPILADNAMLYISKGRMVGAPTPLKVAPLCPAFMVSRLKTVRIMDFDAAFFMFPIGEVDAGGLSSLTTLAFGPFDIAETLKMVSTGLHVLGYNLKGYIKIIREFSSYLYSCPGAQRLRHR
jgi:hypothetical protein